MITDPSHPHAPRWKWGLRTFHRDITRHIRIFFTLYRSFLEEPVAIADFGSAGQLAWGSLSRNPRRDMACSRLGWVIEQELLLYYWHKERVDVNACIQYFHLHREHREHPWVWDRLKQWTDQGDERRVLQLLGLRSLQGRSRDKSLVDSLWHLFVLEAVEELRMKGMSVRQATSVLAEQTSQEWDISPRLLASAQAWSTALGRDILRVVSREELQRMCYPRTVEAAWSAFCLVHHAYRGHLLDTRSLPPFTRTLSCWNQLFWRCRHRYEPPVIHPPEPFELSNARQMPSC